MDVTAKYARAGRLIGSGSRSNNGGKLSEREVAGLRGGLGLGGSLCEGYRFSKAIM